MSITVPMYGFGGGGGASLNFKVVGNPQPTNPKENTIWLNTDVKITGYYFSFEQPENMVNGDVWFPVRTTSTVAFNALKKNNITVYPLSAKQYVSGAWVDVTAMSYQNGEWVAWSRIPPIYTEVEYLESTGTQYIKTGHNLTSNSKLVVVQQGTVAVDGSGHGAYESNKRFHIAFTGDANLYHWGIGSKYGDFTFNTLSKAEAVLDSKNQMFSVNGQRVATGASYNGGQECYLFKINTTGAYADFAKTKLFSAQIYENDVLVRDFVPCYRKSDNVAGLFDLVTERFYTNSGSGTFIVG